MLYLIVSSLVWAFSYGLIKANLGNLDPNFLTACRMLFALLVFIPFLRLKSVSRSQALQLMFIGAVQYGLMYLCFLRSFKYLDAYQAALFTTFTPLYVIIINDFYNKKFNFYYLQVAVLAVLGGAVIYYQNIMQSSILLGFFYVQLADICFAYGQVAYKRLRQNAVAVRDIDIYALLFIGALALAAFSTSLVSGWHSAALMTGKQLIVLLYLGAVASGICFFMWNKGGVTTNTATLAVFNNLKSPLAITVSILFFHESANILRLCIGLGIIGLALYLAEKKSQRLAHAA